MRFNKKWTENVSKYKIELKSVYLTIVTWDLTEMCVSKCDWTKPVYLTWYFEYNIRFIGIS